MPWLWHMIPERIKKYVVVYLLERYLGQFMEEKVTKEQLKVDLWAGTGTIEKITLDIQALNELGETHNWPVEFVDGYIEQIQINLPWTSLLKESSFIKVKGLKITVQPKQRHESATSMFESMWNSMASSMQFAEELVKQEAASEYTTQSYEGLLLTEKTIDSIMGRIKVTFVDTVFQIEHVPKDSSTGVGVVFEIDLLEYSDEVCTDPKSEEATKSKNAGAQTEDDSNTQSFNKKKFIIQGVTLSTVEFLSESRTFSRSVLVHDEENDPSTGIEEECDPNEDDDDSDIEVSQERVENEPELNGDRHVIQFGILSGSQQISVMFKEDGGMDGAKVSILMEFGSLIMFLSPRQFHVLTELANGLASPDIEDTSNVAPRTKCTAKPMTKLDYQRVEQQLQNQLQPLLNLQLTGLRGTHGWSTAAIDESDTEERFLPVRNTESYMYDSTMSGGSSSMESSVSSSMASSVTEYTNRTRRRTNTADSDPSGEISKFQIRFASIAVILLQEDLLLQPLGTDQLLVPSSVQQMHETVEKFFSKLEDCLYLFNHNVNFVDAKNILESACTLNHLRLLAAPVQIGGDEKTTNSTFSVTATMAITEFEVFECLFNPSNGAAEMISILRFSKSSSPGSGSGEPNVMLKLKHVQKTSKRATGNNAGAKNDISVVLKKCEMDLDISIIDRVTALLVSPNLCVVDKSKCNPWAASTLPQLPTLNIAETRTDLKISTAHLNIKLRFPIPDFRPAHDMNRIPWWKRNIRTDYLLLALTNVVFQTTFQTCQAFKEYGLQSKGMQIYYMENEQSSPLHIAKSEFHSTTENILYQIRLSIKIFPAEADDLEECDEPELDPMVTSCYGAFFNQRSEQPGPFSAKKVVHESDTPHYKLHNDESSELIIPGNKAELEEFIKSTSSNTKTLVELFIPMISLQFATKHIYEIIYNRINNDLLLWTPSAPRHKSAVYDTATYSNLRPGGKNFMKDEYDTFTSCKSGIQYESGSDDDESEDKEFFFSTHGQDSSMKTQMQKSTEIKEQSDFVLSIQIAQGVLCLNPPVRDTTTRIIPGQQAEFLLELEDANFFIVNGYRGDENLGYVCVQLHNALLYHCEMISTPSKVAPLRDFGRIIGKHLNSTVYKSEKGMLANARNMGDNREMFTVAVKIQASDEAHQAKTVQVSIGVNKGTLNHRICREPNSWLSHLLDFFNIQDYPIPNYHAKDIVTAVHLHLWDCAIDYRPLHLPVRSAVTIGNFSMSSHVSAPSNSTTLTFIFEECGLFLSENGPPKNGVVSLVPVDLKRDYVNVIDLGIFELSLKTDEKRGALNPHFDLRASNNVFNIHTCADSGKLLLEFLTYLAGDGDLSQPSIDADEGQFSNSGHFDEQELIVVEPHHISYLTESQQDRVKALLADAMKEDDEVEVGTEPGLEFFPKSGYPEIKWLSDDPVRIVEDHFEAPTKRTDPLSPPKSFPCPISRYTLCDMSVVWHMYGGNDFSLPEVGRKKKKTVNFSDSKLTGAVSFSKSEQDNVKFADKPGTDKDNSSWLVKGGLNRDLDVHMEIHLKKIRFQHEVYPETTTQASRQVFVVSDIEIVDRLECSQINKFLYQYFSKSLPKRSNANMVVIKALHMRPDLKLPRQECCLKVSMLPLRFNIDQDALLFLIKFFTDLVHGPGKSDSFTKSTPTHHPPIMNVSDDEEEQWTKQALKVVDENLIMLESKIQLESNDIPFTSSSGASDDSPIFFRDVTFTSEVPIKLDYHGKRVDMTHGSLPGLLMGLAQLNCSELKLKRLRNRKGLLGIDKLINYFLQEWLNDIKKNQLPSILGGLGPMYSLIQLFQGVRDLIWLPIEQYQKDGRIIKGLQRGANSFTTSTTMAVLELTSRLINLIQITAETAYDILSPGPSVRMYKAKGKKKKYHKQPQDVREGMANAICLLREGIGETAENIVQVASQEKEQKGYSGAVGGVIRQIPTTILKPIIVASEATGNVLGGIRSQFVPDARQEDKQKWRSNDS